MFGRTREKTHRQTHTHNKMTDQNNTAEVYDNEMDFSQEVENFVDDEMDYSQDMGDHNTDDEPDCPVCGACGCYDEECEMEIDRAEYQAQYWADF